MQEDGDMSIKADHIDVYYQLVENILACSTNIHRTGSTTWHERANTVLTLSVDIICIDVAMYKADVSLTWRGAHS